MERRERERERERDRERARERESERAREREREREGERERESVNGHDATFLILPKITAACHKVEKKLGCTSTKVI